MQLISGSDTSAIAAIATDVDYLLEEISHESKIFPEDTAHYCELSAGTGANTFGSWATIEDSAGSPNDFSDVCASSDIHISGVVVETVANSGSYYLIEIAYGASKINVGRVRILGGSVPKQETKIRSVVIPAGETVYYRSKCEVSESKHRVHIRYHEHS